MENQKSELIAQELWDKFSSSIGENIDDLQMVAGRSMMDWGEFKRAMESFINKEMIAYKSKANKWDKLELKIDEVWYKTSDFENIGKIATSAFGYS